MSDSPLAPSEEPASFLSHRTGAVFACAFALWAPGALLLGTDAPAMQGVWALWCVACAGGLGEWLRRAAVKRPRPTDTRDDDDIVQGIPLAICACALPGGEILFANDAMVDLTGETRQGLFGRHLGEFCTDVSDSERLTRALAHGQGFDEFELAARRTDGNVRWLSVCARPDSFDGRPALYIVCHDITGHKQAQSSLAASEARFRVLLGALSEAVVLYDAQARVLTRNRAAEACTWLAAAHAGLPGGLADAALFDEQGRRLAPALHPVARSLADGQPVHGAVIGTDDASGHRRWLAVTTQPLFHAGANKAYAVVASFRTLRRASVPNAHCAPANSDMRWRCAA